MCKGAHWAMWKNTQSLGQGSDTASVSSLIWAGFRYGEDDRACYSPGVFRPVLPKPVNWVSRFSVPAPGVKAEIKQPPGDKGVRRLILR
jgi:hypothetical protein